MIEEIYIEIHRLGVPDVNGVVWDPDAVRVAIGKHQHPTFVPFCSDLHGASFSIEEATSVVDLTKAEFHEDGSVTAVLKLLKTPKGRILSDMVKADACRYGLYGRGRVDRVDGVVHVTDFDLLSVAVYPKHEDQR